jgi:hypothetical protein
MNRNVVTLSLAVLAAVAFSTTGHAQGRWKAAAISNSGHAYYAWGSDESGALNNALDKCRTASRSNVCQNTVEKAIAVESWWWLVVADCNGRKFAGGSQWNGDVALENAVGKAPRQLRDSCFQDGEGLAGGVPPNYEGQGQGDIDRRR